jgi:NADH-quinone oxidoreductase subunit A
MEWAHVAVYLLVVALIGSGMLYTGYFLSPRKASAMKLDTYECGMPMSEISATRDRFSVRFYLVAIMFILFDIETVFLIPWAVLYKQLGVAGLVEIGIFFAVLGFGLAYLWKRGGLEWD